MDDIDEYRLEQITADHPIYVGGFIPFAIERLRGRADSTEATLDVHLVDIVGPGEVIRRLRLTWSASSMPAGALAVQERVKTEWAACGVALALLSRYTVCRAHYVAREGNRFDYWVKDSAVQYALEVSGTMTKGVRRRHREKQQQLRGNPFGVGGFVVVVGFVARSAIVSLSKSAETEP